MKRAETLIGQSVPGPYPMLFLWPYFGLNAFLIGGKAKPPQTLRSADWEKRVEIECGIPPLDKP